MLGLVLDILYSFSLACFMVGDSFHYVQCADKFDSSLSCASSLVFGTIKVRFPSSCELRIVARVSEK